MKKLKIDEQEGTLNISYRWMSSEVYLMIVFTLFWDMTLLFWTIPLWGIGIEYPSNPISEILTAIIHIGIGIFLTYHTAYDALNTTYITVNNEQITIEHKPFSAYIGGIKQVNSQDIEQIYVEEEKSTKRGKSSKYTLYVRLKSGEDKVFTPRSVLVDKEDAHGLEQKIEHFLGIQDYKVTRDYKATNENVEKPKEEILPRIIRKKSDGIDLTLNDLTKGAVVNYDLKSWKVVYEIQYDWLGSESDRLLQLASGVGDAILLYLHVDMANITVWVESKLEAHQMMDGALKATQDGSKLKQIVYNGEQYFLSGHMKGMVFARGRDQKGDGGQQWLYLSADRQTSIRKVQTDGVDVVAYAGKLAKEYEFSDILPAD